MTVLIDTNIVIALLKEDDYHHEWADRMFAQLKASSAPLIIPDIVYCEASVAMVTQEHIDQAVAQLGLERLSPNEAALFRAGKAFKKYKDENKGEKTGVLPDFLIGAMAEALDVPILTADPKHFVGYFDNLDVVQPPKKAKGQAVAANDGAAPGL